MTYEPQDAEQIKKQLQCSANGKDVVGLKKLGEISAVDSRTLRGYIVKGELQAVKNGCKYLINLEAAAKFFEGLGCGLWAAADERRKNPKSIDVHFTEKELATELWKFPRPEYFNLEVHGHVALLEASNLGRVRNAFARRGVQQYAIIKPRRTSGGYLSVNITLEPSEAEKAEAKALGKKPNYRPKNLAVHRLTAAAHVDNPENHPQVGHLDNNRKNNRAINLAWCTGNKNIQHGRATGGLGRSTGRPCTKLTDADVKFIRESDLPVAELAKKFNINIRHVFRIRSGERWNNT